MSDTEGQLLLGAGEISPDITPDYHNIERCHEGKVFRKLLTQYTFRSLMKSSHP